MVGVGSDHKPALAQAQQVVFAHQPLHFLAVHPDAAPPEFPRDAAAAVAGPLQRHPLDAVILDAYSRKVIGWALDGTLEATLTIEALQMALRRPKPAPGLVHHSDYGVQYASGDYTDLLKANGIIISMSCGRNPYDNAQCESFMKTLEYEEVYRSEYRDLTGPAPASACSSKRSTTGNACARPWAICPGRVRGPTDGEESGGGGAATGGMSFLRHQRSIHPMWEEQAGSRLGAHSRRSSVRMSRSRLFLGGVVSTSARLRFTSQPQNALQWSCRSSNFEGTTNSVLFACLSQGVDATFGRNGTFACEAGR